MAIAPYTRGMNQDATYWAPGVNDGVGGKAYGSAVAVQCRWQDKAVRFRSPSGDELTSSSIVYVNTEVLPEGKIALGTHVGAPPSDAKDIIQVDKSPSYHGNKQLIKVYL